MFLTCDKVCKTSQDSKTNVGKGNSTVFSPTIIMWQLEVILINNWVAAGQIKPYRLPQKV